MGTKIVNYVLMFFLYSALGWTIESTYRSLGETFRALKTTKEKKTTEEKDSKDSSGLLKLGLIAGAAVIALISLELFIYKMAKLKKNSK